MEHSIQLKDFLNTFTEQQCKDIEEYNTVVDLHREGYSKKQIKQKISVSEDKLYLWRYTDTKPISLKTLNEARTRDYFKPVVKNKLEWLAYLIGYNVGDGNISRNLCNTWFYGVNSDLEKIRNVLLKFNVKPVIYTYKINNGKMAIHDRVFSRFLVCFGAVIGDKTLAKVEVPGWILDSKKASKLKLRFLQGFFDSELSNISLCTKSPGSYKSLKLYTSKSEANIEEGKFFLNQIRLLLREFDVLSSEVKLDRSYFRRRDKRDMQQLYLIIYSNHINLHNFIKNVGFLCNSKRRNNSVEALDKIQHKAKEELHKVKQYRKGLKLRKKGLSAYKIAKKLNVKTHIVKNWVYYHRKPLLYDFIKKISNS